MKCLPRVALGAVDARVDHRPLMWGLLQRLEAVGVQSQCFYSQSRFAASDGVAAISGRSYRHLDAALMTPELCREVLSHGASNVDLAIVESAGGQSAAESFSQLCQVLELPRLLVVDADGDPCHLPPRPERVDGLFLTGATNREAFARERLRWEALWGAPVLGGLVGSAHITAILNRLPAGTRPSAELCRALGDALVTVGDIDGLLSLAARPTWSTSTNNVFQPSPAMSGLRVAVALDDAFDCYFSDTLDLLELNGASLRDFSPLNDPELPRDTDIVYLGCGHVERFAAQLAANPCMIAALRRHARDGGRIYAEGGAAGYLCHQVELEDGYRHQMCGILPGIARHSASPASGQPVEIELSDDCWLGRAGDWLRGYRNPNWRIEPLGLLQSIARQPSARFDLLTRGNVIASQVHLNLVAQPHLLCGFAAANTAAALR